MAGDLPLDPGQRRRRRPRSRPAIPELDDFISGRSQRRGIEQSPSVDDQRPRRTADPGGPRQVPELRPLGRDHDSIRPVEDGPRVVDELERRVPRDRIRPSRRVIGADPRALVEQSRRQAGRRRVADVVGAGLEGEAVTRLVPGALGNAASARQESFSAVQKVGVDGPDSTCGSGGLLDYPHYTRPAEFRGMAVPEVLIGGNHEQIRKWRRGKALEKTLRNRPDLLERQPLSEEDKKFLAEVGKKKIGRE